MVGPPAQERLPSSLTGCPPLRGGLAGPLQLTPACETSKRPLSNPEHLLNATQESRST